MFFFSLIPNSLRSLSFLTSNENVERFLSFSTFPKQYIKKKKKFWVTAGHKTSN